MSVVTHAIDLAEHVLVILEEAAGGIDDSRGDMAAAIARVQEIHLRACEEGNPDPVALGRRLAERGARSGWQVFDDAIPTYTEILGDAGLASYRAELDREWSELPPLAPGDRHDYNHRRYAITTLKKNLGPLRRGHRRPRRCPRP